MNCPHITCRIRAVASSAHVQIGARVAASGELWWCVGCGTLFADEKAELAIATPTAMRRLTECKHGEPACPACVSEDLLFHLSTLRPAE